MVCLEFLIIENPKKTLVYKKRARDRNMMGSLFTIREDYLRGEFNLNVLLYPL